MENDKIEILEDANKKKGSKRPYVIAIVLALALVVTITATSYAYFVGTVNNTTTPTTIDVTTTSLGIEFTDGPTVSLQNAIPGQYIEKTFKIENTGSGDTTYDVYMSDLINDFADKTDLVYTLTSNDGGANVSSQTQVPATSSKIVNAHLLRAGEAHNYTLRIEFKETNDNQDDNKGKQFSTIIRVNEVQNAQLPYSIESGDLDTVGSVVKIGMEEFYVIGQEDASHVKLLSKWNLNVGGEYNTSWTAYTNPTGIQDSAMLGYVSGQTIRKGTTSFSSDSQKGTYYSYYNGSIVEEYVNDYVAYLNTNNQGLNATGRLILKKELETLGCSSSDYSCNNAPSWIYSTSYWSGSSNYTYNVWSVRSDGYFSILDYYYDFGFGVRPVIILEK